MTTIDSTAGLNGVEPLNLKISTENNCAPASSDHSASSPTSSTKSCGENIVPSGTGVSGPSQDQGAPNSTSPAINLAIGNTTTSPNLSPKQPLSSNNSGQSVSVSTGTNVFIAPLTNKNNLLNNEANVKSNVPGQNIMNSNLIKPNVNNGSPTKLPIARIKKPAPLKPAPAQPVAHIAPNSTMLHPKPILPAPHNPSPVKTVHIAAKPPSASVTNNNNKAIPAPTALINFLPSQSKTSPKSAQNGKQPDDAKSVQSLPSINTLTNGATFNLNQNQFYQFVPVSSQHLAALAAANGGNGAGNPLIIATTSMPKSYLAAPNRTDASGTESSPAAGQLVMKTIPPNIDPLLQQQYLNLMQQKPPQLKLSPKGAVKPTSPNQTNANSTANKPPLTVLPKPTQPQATPSSQPSSTPNDDYLALQQRLLAEERRNNLLENKLREQELLQQKHMHQIQPNPTINTTPTPSGACAIKPKPIAVKPAPSDDSKIVTTPSVSKTDSNNESGIHDESLISAKSTPTNASKSATNPSGKKRGRPRLYDVDPQTGKSIKPKQTTPMVTMQHQIQPQPSPQLLKMVINPSSNMLIMSAPRTQNPVNSAPPAMFPSPSTSNTSSDVPNERVLPKRDNEIQIDKQTPGQEKSPTIASNSHSEKENNNDQCKRAESGSPSKRKKTSPVKVVDESLSNKAPKTPPAQKAATGIPKQITPANLSPSAPLTHLLDGYIVKEAGKPFPLAKSQSNSSNKKHKSDEHVKCDQCGAKFNKKSGIGGAEDQSVLFCSESCAKRYKKKSKHRSDSTEMSKRFKHDQEINGDVTKTPPRQKLNSSMTTDSPSSKRSPHCKHYGSSSKHKHHSSSHKKDHHRGGHHSSHNHNNSISNGNNNDDTAMEGSFVQPAPVLASSTLSQTPIRTSSPNTSLMDTSATYPSGDPTNWSCDQVYQFVLQVTNNEQVARLFKTEEVDGSALSLIRDDHLVQTMQVKLGPALKIMSKFTELKAKYGH